MRILKGMKIFMFCNFNDGKWDLGMSVGKDLNTEYSEAPLFVYPLGDKLVVYAGYEGSGDIMVSTLKKNRWRIS